MRASFLLAICLILLSGVSFGQGPTIPPPQPMLYPPADKAPQNVEIPKLPEPTVAPQLQNVPTPAKSYATPPTTQPAQPVAPLSPVPNPSEYVVPAPNTGQPYTAQPYSPPVTSYPQSVPGSTVYPSYSTPQVQQLYYSPQPYVSQPMYNEYQYGQPLQQNMIPLDGDGINPAGAEGIYVGPAISGGQHQRFPYYDYRRPWYTRGPASRNVDIVW